MSHGLPCTWHVHVHMSALHFMCLTGNGRSRESYLSPLAHQYDAVPIQSSVVLCSCPSPSMVRPQTESSAAPGVPSGGSRQGPTMDSTATEPRPSATSLQHTTQPPPQPRKKRPEDFKFGKILGEGSFSTVSTRCCDRRGLSLDSLTVRARRWESRVPGGVLPQRRVSGWGSVLW